MPICLCSVYGCFCTKRQSWVVVTETLWPIKPNIFAVWLIIEKNLLTLSHRSLIIRNGKIPGWFAWIAADILALGSSVWWSEGLLLDLQCPFILYTTLKAVKQLIPLGFCLWISKDSLTPDNQAIFPYCHPRCLCPDQLLGKLLTSALVMWLLLSDSALCLLLLTVEPAILIGLFQAAWERGDQVVSHDGSWMWGYVRK